MSSDVEHDSSDEGYYEATEAEKREFEEQNEAADARCFVLGGNAAAAIDVDGAGAGTGTGNGTRTGSTSTTAGASTSVKHMRRRGPTSKVWLDFEEVTAIQGVKRYEYLLSAFTARVSYLLNLLRELGTCSVT